MVWVPVIIGVAFIGGLAWNEVFSKGQIDSPPEQLAEAILESQGIVVDFSADEKREREEAENRK